MKYEPRGYAPLVAAHFAKHPRCALWAKPGMGKTSLTLNLIDTLINVVGEDVRVLVIAPLRVARDTWKTETEKWDHLKALRISVCIGLPAERETALETPHDILVTNYEQLPWLVKKLDKAWPYTMVIADESTKIKGYRARNGGIRAAALARIAQRTTRWVNLTGTPASNSLIDLWGQTWFLDWGHRLGRTFTSFRDRWFWQPMPGKWLPLESAQAQIQERIKDICLTLDPSDWFDLAKPVVNNIKIELTDNQIEQYEKLESDMFLKLKEGDVEAFNPGALTMKCLQFAGGAVYTDSGWEKVHDHKLDALDEIIDESGDDPILISCNFRTDFMRIKERHPDALDLRDKHDLGRALRGEGKLWLAHPKSGGHGIDGLQHYCNTIVFFAQDWNLEEHDQIIERIGPTRQAQAGRKNPVFIHYLVASRTVDEVVMKNRSKKAKVMDALLEYMKEKQ